jgi:hypothetical protein
VNDEIFGRLISFERTDFLFFISSSSFRRFANQRSFRTHFPDLDPARLRECAYSDVHRVVLEYYRSKIPATNATRLYPFSIRKEQNIYGLVFGSKHRLGVEKFLNIAWDKNRLNGEANFDIDDDSAKAMPTLFPELRRPTKLEAFGGALAGFIQDRKQVSNRDVYDFALESGHAPRQARDILFRLRKAGVITFDGNIGCSYKICYKDRNIKPIKAVKHGEFEDRVD